jgi:LTXXQ motif family protein
MLFHTRCAIAALALAFTPVAVAPAVFAQTPPQPQQSDQDHKAHHPDGKVPDSQSTPQTPAPPPPSGATGGKMGMMGQDGVMCGDMKQMMSMMHDMHAMMKAQAGMMSQRAEADIAKFKADLKITDAQLPQWNRFADALSGWAKAMDDSHRQLMTPAGDTLPGRLGKVDKSLANHLASVKAVEDALQPLYASLSEEQKKVADAIRIGPMGMM